MVVVVGAGGDVRLAGFQSNEVTTKRAGEGCVPVEKEAEEEETKEIPV